MIRPARFQTSSRRGSALVLVLAVLVSCVGLVSGVQGVLMSRARLLAQEAAEVELRGALLLGLRDGMERWADEEALPVSRDGEEPGATWEWVTDSGVEVMVHLRDAQDRLNLNHLTLPVTPEFPRSAMDMLEDLLAVTDPEADPEIFFRFREAVEEADPWFSGAGLLEVLEPGTREWRAVRPYLVALPHPRQRWLPVNVNTAPPELLRAMLGDSFAGWIDTLVQARRAEPIQDLSLFLRFLPEPARAPVDRVLDVGSSYAELYAVAETAHTRREVTAWLLRSGAGEVEVVRCRW